MLLFSLHHLSDLSCFLVSLCCFPPAYESLGLWIGYCIFHVDGPYGQYSMDLKIRIIYLFTCISNE